MQYHAISPNWFESCQAAWAWALLNNLDYRITGVYTQEYLNVIFEEWRNLATFCTKLVTIDTADHMDRHLVLNILH